MSYPLKIFEADASPEQMRAAEQRFRSVLYELGHACADRPTISWPGTHG